MITYREDFGVYWPDYDHKPEKCYKKVQGQIWAMDIAINLCGKHRELCIQAGGHAGLWPKRLAKSFRRVLTFEPEPALFACMVRNLVGIPNVEMHEQALGREAGTAMLLPHVSAGGWRVSPEGTLPVPQVTIDSLNVPACDAIFLDVEGYEVEALSGGLETITKFRPALHVEVLARSRDGIQEFMTTNGYKRHAVAHADEIFTFTG